MGESPARLRIEVARRKELDTARDRDEALKKLRSALGNPLSSANGFNVEEMFVPDDTRAHLAVWTTEMYAGVLKERLEDTRAGLIRVGFKVVGCNAPSLL